MRAAIHWVGGVHTEFEMDKPGYGSYRRMTSVEALEVIRLMAGRYRDDQIAAVLNRSGYRTGKDKRWNQTRVHRPQSLPDPRLTARWGCAARGRGGQYCGVSIMAIRRLVAIGVLKCEQVVPYAPWEIRRSDLDSPTVRSMLECLKQTGKFGTLQLERDGPQSQQRLFNEH